jgi:hypothetical protein
MDSTELDARARLRVSQLVDLGELPPVAADPQHPAFFGAYKAAILWVCQGERRADDERVRAHLRERHGLPADHRPRWRRRLSRLLRREEHWSFRCSSDDPSTLHTVAHQHLECDHLHVAGDLG